MEKHISATQAARTFSDLLNKIKFQGDSYIIERSGKPIAKIESVKEAGKFKTLKDLKSVLEQLPHLDDELDAFASDLGDFWANQPPLPEGGLWE